MLWEFKDKIDATIAEIDKMGESLTTFLESSSFEGETANSIKSYFNEIHGSMLSSIKTTAQRVQDDMARYKAGFCTIDAYTNFILDQDIIQQYDQAMNDYCDDTEGYMEEISKALATTASIFNYTYPSGSEKDVTTEHSNMDQKLIQFKSDITAHESDIVNDVTKVTEQMINQISVVNKTIGVEWKDLKDYNSGDGNNNLELCKLVYVAGELDAERKENEEVYVQIWDNEVSLKEAAEAREEQGVWEMIGGGILAITGVVCIVCTGGAATPIVVAGWVAGGGTVAFGMADMIEGSDDIYYGSIGDINSTSTNDIKTLIKNLGGDEKTYYMIENAFAFTASALCPIGKASIAKELTFKSGAQILVREGVSDFTAGKVSDFVYNKTGNRVLSMAAGMASSAGTSKAFDYGDVALGWAKNKVTSVGTSKENSSFADGMSPEEIARYDAYWNKVAGEKLTSVGNQKAFEILETQSKKSAGPCLSTIYDPELDNFYFGQNFKSGNKMGKVEYINWLNNDADIIIKERTDLYQYEIDNEIVKIQNPCHDDRLAAHSEIRALDQALAARRELGYTVNEETLKELYLYNIDLTELYKNNIIIPKPRCENCSRLTDGINTVIHN